MVPDVSLLLHYAPYMTSSTSIPFEQLLYSCTSALAHSAYRMHVLLQHAPAGSAYCTAIPCKQMLHQLASLIEMPMFYTQFQELHMAYSRNALSNLTAPPNVLFPVDQTNRCVMSSKPHSLYFMPLACLHMTCFIVNQ